MDFDYIVVGGVGRLRAGGAAQRGSVGVVALIEAGPADRTSSSTCPRDSRCWRRQDGELELPHRAAERPQRSHRLAAARQGAGRLELGQRDGLHPRPPRRLRPLGRRRQRGLVLRRRAALLPPRRAQRAPRRRVPRQRRSAQRDGPAQPQQLRAGLHRGRPRGGLPITDDFNGADQEGIGPYQVTHKNGERFSAAKAYLTPNLGRKNLTVFTEAHTTRILFEGKRATGVEFRRGAASSRSAPTTRC